MIDLNNFWQLLLIMYAKSNTDNTIHTIDINIPM